MAKQTTRRDFVKESVALGTAFWVGGRTVLGQESNNPLEKINIACIGAQGKGSSDTSNSAHWGANVVALCDIDDRNLKKKAAEFKDVELFHDYREMFDKFADKFDAVTVSTPDHSHAPASIMAMRHGKHVYCQKPLTWSVLEARRMREIAEETGVVTQMGNQGTSENGLREAVEVVKSGGIGEISEVHIWTNRPVWPQGTGRPEETPATPPWIKWDLFLGPAPERPYHPAYHPFKWRGWLDFGTGALGDMACHTANMAVMACDLFEPSAFETVENSGIVENETFPKYSIIKFEFPKTDDRPAVNLFWYDGGKLPDPELMHGRKPSKSGSLIVGSKGTLFSPNDYGAQFFLLPEDKFVDYKKPDPWLPRVETEGSSDQRHMSEFIAACRGEGKTTSNFGYAGRLTETILLGNIALRANSRIEWDSQSMKCTNNSDANQFIHRDYREGWSI